jgi:CBS-domain-containing membrane protein
MAALADGPHLGGGVGIRKEASMRVADLMTKDVACCRANEPLSVAAKLMWDSDCGALPVLDDAGERVVGMITDRDICMCTWMRRSAPQDIPVNEAMSRTLHACSPGDSVASAEAVMRDNKIRRLPVLDAHGRLDGIISLADIVREAERERNRPQKEVGADEIAQTLATICQPPANGPERLA